MLHSNVGTKAAVKQPSPSLAAIEVSMLLSHVLASQLSAIAAFTAIINGATLYFFFVLVRVFFVLLGACFLFLAKENSGLFII